MILNQGKVAGGLVDELLEVVHVYPLNDLRDHIVEGRDCRLPSLEIRRALNGVKLIELLNMLRVKVLRLKLLG